VQKYLEFDSSFYTSRLISLKYVDLFPWQGTISAEGGIHWPKYEVKKYLIIVCVAWANIQL